MRSLFKNILENYVKTVGPRTEVDEITTVALILQRIFGQQVLDPNWTWKRFSFHYIFFLSIFIYVFFGTLETLQNNTDADLVAEANYTLIMIFVFPIKLFIFISNRFTFRDLYLLTKEHLIPAIKESGNFDKIHRKTHKIVYFLLAIVIIPTLNYEIIALINYINGRYTPLSRTTSSLMPNRSPYHEVAWILHTVFMYLISTTIILDMWFVLLIYFQCLASDNLVKILEKREKSEIDINTYKKGLNNCLNNFYKKHIVFVRFLTTMNKMYKWLALVPLCNAAMGISMILLVMSKDVNLRFGPHVMPMFAEIFAYNWFGEQIKSKARSINIALLNFDWMSLKVSDRKSYYIIVTFVNKAEFGVKTAIGNDLCLITMSSVLRATYQAFTVLQSVE